MNWAERHADRPHARLDGGDLDCGSGLLLAVRRHLASLPRGHLLEVVTSAETAADDLPAWCRLTGNALVSCVRSEGRLSFLMCKGALPGRSGRRLPKPPAVNGEVIHGPVPSPAPAPPLPPLAVVAPGSWPRPRWLVRALHEHLDGITSEAEFQAAADDAVRLAVAAQIRAGADAVTDGEQRRDHTHAAVACRLDNCQGVPVADLLPYAADPAAFEAAVAALGVDATRVRQPVTLAALKRSRPLAAHEYDFLRKIAPRPATVHLPGPYLLTRLLSLEFTTGLESPPRETLADEVVGVLRDELAHLLAAGAALVQFDEPGLADVAARRPQADRSFPGAGLAPWRDTDEELTVAGSLVNRVVTGLPRERVAVRLDAPARDAREPGGDYVGLVPLLRTLQVGTIVFAMTDARAGTMAGLRALPESFRIGVGVVRADAAGTVASAFARADEAIAHFGPERVLLTPDAGFAPHAHGPLTPAEAEAKLSVVAQAARLLCKRYAVGEGVRG
jgi:5-methyltetrahydropteroyltriglutamate--homocysteine methyltransferase